jgi:hypothetical protein
MVIVMAVLTRLPSSRLGGASSFMAVFRHTFLVVGAWCSILPFGKALPKVLNASTAFTLIITIAVHTPGPSSRLRCTSSTNAMFRLAIFVSLAFFFVRQFCDANSRRTYAESIIRLPAFTVFGLAVLVMMAIVTGLPLSVYRCTSLIWASIGRSTVA